MSFGYSLGDVLAVTKLAWRCFRNAKEACGEYDELTREAWGLHSVLRQLQLEITNSDSIINRLGDDRKKELIRLVAGCDEVLGQVDRILSKYDALQAKKPRYGSKLWQRINFGNLEKQDLDQLRQKMAHHTNSITFLCTLVGIGSQGRMEKFMCGEFLELRRGIDDILWQKKARTSTNESSILTKYGDDDRAVWKDFRQELGREGYDSSFIRTNMGHIKAYVKELGDRGALDSEDTDGIQDRSSSAFEGPVQSEVSIAAIGIQQTGPLPSPRFLIELDRIWKRYGLNNLKLEPQESFSDSENVSKTASSDRISSLNLSNGSQKPTSAPGAGSQRDQGGPIVKKDVTLKPPHAKISGDNTPKKTDITAHVQATKATAGATIAPNEHPVPIDCDYMAVPKPLENPIFDVPLETIPYYVGRLEALSLMDSALRPEYRSSANQRVRRQACGTISGMGGTGKSRLAVKYAYTRRSMFKAVFWIHAASKNRLADGFSRIALSCGLLSSHEAKDSAVSRKVVLQWLCSTNIPWLLIFDNADDPILIQDYWPISCTGAIIVTSRAFYASSWFFESVEIKVQPLSRDESLSLLYQSMRREPRPEDLKNCLRLLECLGYHPLAISQAGTYMSTDNVSLEYSLSLLEKFDSTDLPSVSDNLSSYTDNHFSVWETMFTYLAPRSLRMLEIISFWDPDCISESILDLDHIPRTTTENCTTELINFACIRRHEDTKQISVHRLMQEATRKRMHQNELADAFGAAIGFLVRAWPWNTNEFGGQVTVVGECEELISHVLSMKALYESMCLHLAVSVKQQLAGLLQRVGWVSISLANYQIAYPVLFSALSICKGEDFSDVKLHADVLHALVTLGTKTNYQPSMILGYASEHLNYRIKSNEGTIGSRNLLSMAHCALAQGNMLNGDYTEAIKNCNRSRKVVTEYLEDCQWVQWADIYEAWCLMAMGKLEEAEAMILRAYEIQLLNHKSNSSDTLLLAESLKCLANIRARQGLLEESFTNHEEALVNFVATTGFNSYETNMMCIKVGEHHTRLDQYETAGIYFKKAMAWFKIHEFYTPEVTFLNHKLA